MKRRIAAARPHFPDEDLDAILPAIERILRSGRLILGEQTAEFEQRFARYVGADHAVAVGTCTAAIQIALRFYGAAGREVVLPTNNFIGVASAVIAEGGTPILAEMDPETFCVDTEDAISRITPRTAGIIVVHIAGLVQPDADRLRMFCEERGLFLVEDASHAHGASRDGRQAGSFAETACFSFYPTKIVTTGTGGMLVTRNPELAAFARSVRHHGVGGSLDDVVNLGSDWCLSEIHALLGIHQLRRLDEHVAHRNRLVDVYRTRLEDADWLRIPAYGSNQRHAYYKFPVLLREGADRDGFRRRLWEEHGVENGGIYTPPCHLQPVLRSRFGFGPGMFPRAEATLARQICPPVHSAMPPAEADAAADAMIATAKACGLA